MHWKAKLYSNANQIAAGFMKDPRILGVALGGSLGRGVAWKHSDLELCILVEERIEEFQHFNVMEGMGVEIFQFTRPRIEQFLVDFKGPDESVLEFRIQIYGCRIIYDPTGLLSEFKATFDRSLFHEKVTGLKSREALRQADTRLDRAKELLGEGRFRTAAAHLRIGLNDLILAAYWQHGMLPRSQNRTEYFLKKNIRVFGHDQLYKAFIRAFCLDQPLAQMKERLLQAKREIHSLAETLWGSNSPQFFQQAVDGNLEWGYDKSILYVYKYCVHRMQCSSLQEAEVYDRESYNEQYGRLYRFLDLEELGPRDVKEMVRLYEAARGKSTCS
ncbi:hypothetical protein [Paenibacillus silviterrae]|uniref:hypothetical protein n=1 Tax=Paenibacillus silviterrae TaxID=3242194 RepID=UPI0025439EB0|nr:hypothetical protein [Paenibacillus chinjuensis]